MVLETTECMVVVVVKVNRYAIILWVNTLLVTGNRLDHNNLVCFICRSPQKRLTTLVESVRLLNTYYQNHVRSIIQKRSDRKCGGHGTGMAADWG